MRKSCLDNRALCLSRRLRGQNTNAWTAPKPTYLKIEQPHRGFHKWDKMHWFCKCSAFRVMCEFVCKLKPDNVRLRRKKHARARAALYIFHLAATPAHKKPQNSEDVIKNRRERWGRSVPRRGLCTSCPRACWWGTACPSHGAHTVLPCLPRVGHRTAAEASAWLVTAPLPFVRRAFLHNF